MNHLSAQTTFKVKDGVSLDAHRDAAHFSLHFTAPGSSSVNDMVLRTSPLSMNGRSAFAVSELNT